MKLASLFAVVFGICALNSAYAGGSKKESLEGFERDPDKIKERRERSQAKREAGRQKRLEMALKNVGIEKAAMARFLETATPQERKEIAETLHVLSRASDFFGEDMYRQEAFRDLKARLGLLRPKDQPEIHYFPNDPVGVRRTAMRDLSIAETASAKVSWEHVLEQDEDTEVRALAAQRLGREHPAVSDRFLFKPIAAKEPQ